MPKCSNGAIYENFPKGRVFIEKGDRAVTIKVYRTHCGRITKLEGWLCVSWRSGRPIVYLFDETAGIRNVTYREIERQIHSLTNRIIRSKADQKKRKKLQKKFVSFCCKSLYGESFKNIDLNGKIIKTWLPLLSSFDNREIEKAEMPLNSSLIRQGLKQSSLELAVSTWFKQSPPELIRRIESLLFSKDRQIELKHRLAQLTLLIACREWNLQELYSLCDLSTHCCIPLNIEKARRLFATYTPQRWLFMLEHFNLTQNRRVSFILDLAIDKFNRIDYQSHLLPQEPQSMEEISNALYNLLEPCQISCEIISPFCCCDTPPVLLMIDCLICSKPYPYKK